MSDDKAHKYLTLIRHGHVQTLQSVKVDRDQPLSGLGMKKIDQLRESMHTHFLNVDYILCSNARRTRQTLDGIRRSIPERAQIMFEDRLYGATAQYLLERIRRTEDRYHHILIIGHNPALQDFTSALAEAPCNMNSGLQSTEPGTALFLKSPLSSWFQADFHAFQVIQQYP